MLKDKFVTAFLLLLLTAIITSSVARLHSLGQQPSTHNLRGGLGHSLRKELSAVKTKQEWDDLLNRLPTADYEAPEPGEPEGQEKRRVRNSRYDKRGMVVKNPDASVTLTEVHYEGKEAWPLPIEQSDVVIVGEVKGRQSYLSNDKSGVYTEFTIAISEVLKDDLAEIKQETTITASRVGGVVRYPGGHKRLYLVSGEGLPLEDGQFVLFLKKDGQDGNYMILTMYQLEADGVLPIDEGSQFEQYRGQKTSDFIKAIQVKVGNPPNSHP